MSDLIVSRTLPVELGPQAPENSIPVVISSTEDTVINVKQSQPETEVALSLLGIPRSETTLGVFSDVTTYGIDTEIWAQFPEVWTSDQNGRGHGVRFLEYSSAAKIEAPPGKYAFLNTKRAFPYLPGRVSSSTFGLRCAFENRPSITSAEFRAISAKYDGLTKQPVRKWGQYSDKNGYYFEIKGVGLGDNFKVVRRTNGIDSTYIQANYPFQSTFLPENSFYRLNNTVKRAPSGIRADNLNYIHAVINDVSMEVPNTTTNAVSVYDPFESRYRLVDQENALVYEYRIPRSWFNSDQLNGKTSNNILYSDVITIDGVTYSPGELSNLTDTSVRNIEFDKVTMYKTEYSWYGAIGCIFLTYVPVFESTARWVKVHYLRGSNQLSFPTLGNPYLPMRFYIQNPAENTDTVEGIEKYGASYYIDGADKGSVRVYSALNETNLIIGSGEIRQGTQLGTVTTWGIFNEYAYPYIKIAGNNSSLNNYTYLIGSYVMGSIVALKNNQSVEVYINPGSITITQVKRDSTGIYLFLNKPIFEKIDSSGVSSVTPSSFSFKILSPRGISPLGIKMKKTIGPANVVSKSTVFPVRSNVGNTGNNAVITKLVKNARRPIVVNGGNFRYGAVYNNGSSNAINISSDIREINIQFVVPTVSDFALTNLNECTMYIRDIPGIFKSVSSSSSTGYKILNGTFTRYEPGEAVSLVPLTSPGNIVSTPLNVSTTNYGYDVGLQEGGYTLKFNGFFDASSDDAYGSNLFNKSSDVFSAINYCTSDDVCPLFNTGQQLVTLITSPSNSDDYDLTPYFGFNKEFLAGSGLTINYRFDDTLILIANAYNPTAANATSNIITNLTWEEQ